MTEEYDTGDAFDRIWTEFVISPSDTFLEWGPFLPAEIAVRIRAHGRSAVHLGIFLEPAHPRWAI